MATSTESCNGLNNNGININCKKNNVAVSKRNNPRREMRIGYTRFLQVPTFVYLRNVLRKDDALK